MHDSDLPKPTAQGDREIAGTNQEKEPLDPSDEMVKPLEEAPVLPDQDETPAQLVDEPLAYDKGMTGVPAPDEKPDSLVVESRARRFFRKLIRWVAGLLIIFGLGFLTGNFVLYQPARQENLRNEELWAADLESANAEIFDLQNQASDLEGQIASLVPLKDKNSELMAAQDRSNLHIAILDARVDVTSALLALAEGDTAAARITLDKTDSTLDEISDLLDPDQRNVIDTMKQRLELALSEIEEDPYAAQSDLDVLATNLLQLEDALFSE